MPSKATMEQRIAWHAEHQRHCSCRPIPEGVLRAMDKEGPEPTIAFASPKEWREWLAKHHESYQGIWMRIYKKESGTPSPNYAEALDEALCFGWIDGQKKPLDESSWLQRFVPRRARSKWSKINREHAERLTKSGKMEPSGLREVERAKEDGRWSAAYDSPSTSQVPDDLRKALDANKAASDFFEKLSKVNRYAILYRAQTVKKAETRAKKIEQYVEMLARGETIYPQKD